MQRTTNRLINAFTSLLTQRHYHELSIGDIAAAAEVGRSTFYRHFKSKAELLVGMHRRIFDQMFEGLDSPEAWLATAPPESLVQFLRAYETKHGLRQAVAYRLGADMGFVSRLTRQLLTQKTEENLARHFTPDQLNCPLRTLAQSISGANAWVVTQWLAQPQKTPVEELAAQIHRFNRASLMAALERE